MAVFNPDRFGFCVIGDKIVVMDADKRDMSTRTWMQDTLRLAIDDIDIVPRGYIMPGRIQFFVGDSYTTCAEITEDIVADAISVYASLYDEPNTIAIQTPVYNGVWPGNEGEKWPPVMVWDFDAGRWSVA